jgi:hypothetical protein
VRHWRRVAGPARAEQLGQVRADGEERYHGEEHDPGEDQAIFDGPSRLRGGVQPRRYLRPSR